MIRSKSLLGVYALFILILSGCRDASVESQQEQVQAGGYVSQSNRQDVRVTVESVKRRDIKKVIEQPGHVAAYETTAVHARVDGYVESLSVDVGDIVKRGQILALLSIPELDEELAQKRALVGEAKARIIESQAAVEVADRLVEASKARQVESTASLVRAEGQLAFANAEHRRIADLLSRQAVTQALLEETKSKLVVAEAGCDEAKAKIARTGADVAQAEASLLQARASQAVAEARLQVAVADQTRAEAIKEFATIHAPFAGTVVERHVDTGHLIRAGSTEGSRPLFVVARIDRCRIQVDVPEEAAISLEPGDEATISIDALKKNIQATVSRRSWSLNDQARTIYAEIDFDNADGLVRPGMYARVQLVSDKRSNVIAIPSSAVLRDEKGPFCFTAVDGRAHKKRLTLGLEVDDLVEINEGLSEGVTLVVTNLTAVRDGRPLNVISSSTSASDRR